jgi:DNA gyrase/topoisomerase IV subunit B
MAVSKRPINLAQEVNDNAVDNAIAGFVSRLMLLQQDGSPDFKM